MRRLRLKKTIKKDKEKAILFGLVELFIKMNTPIGSNTLRENGFKHLSSATIRNYFGKLEKLGFLKQKHSSGGRIPTSLAYREYVNSLIGNIKISEKEEKEIKKLLTSDCKKLNNYLQKASEKLSRLCKGAVFSIFPHLDQDFLQDIKLISLNEDTILCVLITSFGLIKTELLHMEEELSSKELKLIENFFLWRISKLEKPKKMPESLTKLSQRLYSEIILRYFTKYSIGSTEQKYYKAGFSNLLSHPEFKDPTILANSLSFFEDIEKINILLNDCMKINKLTCWIGEELSSFGSFATNCSIIAIPYRINHIPVGAFCILVPQRTNYSKIFKVMQLFEEYVSESITKAIYKFKIKFHPASSKGFFQKKNSIMLEDKRTN